MSEVDRELREQRERNAVLYTQLQATARRATIAESDRDAWRSAAQDAVALLKRVQSRTAELVQKMRVRE